MLDGGVRAWGVLGKVTIISKSKTQMYAKMGKVGFLTGTNETAKWAVIVLQKLFKGREEVVRGVELKTPIDWCSCPTL